MRTRSWPGSRACSPALYFVLCSLGRHGLASPHDISDRPHHAWGLRPQIRPCRSRGAMWPDLNDIEHLANVPGEHVPQSMWHNFLICYGQNSQDFIDTRRHVSSLAPRRLSPPSRPTILPFSAHPILMLFRLSIFCLPVFFALLNRCILLVVFAPAAPVRVVLCIFQHASDIASLLVH